MTPLRNMPKARCAEGWARRGCKNLMPRDFTHGRFPPRKLNKNTVGGKMPLAFKIAGTVFLLFWMSMPVRGFIEMLSKEKLASLREAPFPAVLMILVPAIFPIAGLAGLISIWRRRAPTGQSAEESPLSAEMQPVQPPTGKDSNRRLGVVNFILPFAFGFKFFLPSRTFDKFFILIFPAIGIALAVSCVRDVLRRARTGRYEVEIAFRLDVG